LSSSIIENDGEDMVNRQLVIGAAFLLIFLGSLFFFPLGETGFVVQDEPLKKVEKNAFQNTLFVTKIVKYPMRVSIIPPPPPDQNLTVGIAKSFDLFDFSEIPGHDTTVTKQLTFKNKELPAKVTIQVSGSIAPLIVVEDVPLVLRPHEEKNIIITLHAKDTPPANYSGVIEVVSVSPKHKFLYPLLPIL